MILLFEQSLTQLLFMHSASPRGTSGQQTNKKRLKGDFENIQILPVFAYKEVNCSLVFNPPPLTYSFFSFFCVCVGVGGAHIHLLF